MPGIASFRPEATCCRAPVAPFGLADPCRGLADPSAASGFAAGRTADGAASSEGAGLSPLTSPGVSRLAGLSDPVSGTLKTGSMEQAALLTATVTRRAGDAFCSVEEVAKPLKLTESRDDTFGAGLASTALPRISGTSGEPPAFTVESFPLISGETPSHRVGSEGSFRALSSKLMPINEARSALRCVSSPAAPSNRFCFFCGVPWIQASPAASLEIFRLLRCGLGQEAAPTCADRAGLGSVGQNSFCGMGPSAARPRAPFPSLSSVDGAAFVPGLVRDGVLMATTDSPSSWFETLRVLRKLVPRSRRSPASLVAYTDLETLSEKCDERRGLGRGGVLKDEARKASVAASNFCSADPLSRDWSALQTENDDHSGSSWSVWSDESSGGVDVFSGGFCDALVHFSALLHDAEVCTARLRGTSDA
eukprot:scaffold343_cov245-Pinguiococcus_pyrenoidosus.AAC.42